MHLHGAALLWQNNLLGRKGKACVPAEELFSVNQASPQQKTVLGDANRCGIKNKTTTLSAEEIVPP